MKKVIIHCTATKNGVDYRAVDIHTWHKKRGFSGIGYHYVIGIDGIVEKGRPEFWQGAHAHKHNKGSIGICLVGTDDYTRDQWLALDDLIHQIRKKYPLVPVIGHNEVSRKKCPGFNVQDWMLWRGRLGRLF